MFEKHFDIALVFSIVLSAHDRLNPNLDRDRGAIGKLEMDFPAGWRVIVDAQALNDLAVCFGKLDKGAGQRITPCVSESARLPPRPVHRAEDSGQWGESVVGHLLVRRLAVEGEVRVRLYPLAVF